MRLRDRVAIVTGGGSGIGKAISLGLAKDGANVVLAGRRRERLEQTAQEIRALGQRALAVPTDVRQLEQVEDMVQKAKQEFGRIDILVNNATAQHPASFLDISEEEWFDTMNVVIHGTWRCWQAVSKVMIPQKSGSVINIICLHAQMGFPWVHLGTAKSFQVSYTKGLAGEVAPHGIRVNAVAPGLVATEGMLAASDANAFNELVKGPLGRACEPEDVASAVCFLASDEAAYITGAIITVDGGASALIRGGRRIMRRA
ncbi:MAG: glucose 1-dehydrogenase [Chloroflexi bacterium]|nr:glucose 1-dehydrogenase [Chloroflexota bacterium]